MVTVQSGYVPFPRNEPVELRDGEARSVTLRLDRTGVIVGRIVDEYGDPAVRASVRAARRSAYGGAPTTMSMAMTDDLGQFRLFDLRPGVYQLSAMSMAFGYASVGAAQNVGPRTGYAPTYYPGVASPELAQPITVRAAQESHAVFALARVTLGCVRGSVIDSTGAALVQGRGQASGGSVTLYPRMQDLSGFVGGRSGPLQADGTFGICEVPPGDYYVAASLYRGGGTPGAPPASEGGYAPVTVNGDDVHVDVQTNQGATISGRVVIEGNAAPSAGPASAAPARLSVSVRPAQMSSFGGMPGSSRSATVDEIGSFELIGVRGAILLTASINGPAAVLKSVQRGSEDITTTPLDLVGTERIGDVTIVLTRDLGRLEGTVTNSRGEPVPEATIVVFSEDLKRGTDGSPFTRVARSGQAPPVAAPGATASASTTRGPGQYQLPTLVPGRYLAVAFDAGGEPLPLLEGAFLEKLRSLATAVTIAPNDATKLDLTLSKVPVGG
jgi:hypothetical protein